MCRCCQCQTQSLSDLESLPRLTRHLSDKVSYRHAKCRCHRYSHWTDSRTPFPAREKASYGPLHLGGLTVGAWWVQNLHYLTSIAQVRTSSLSCSGDGTSHQLRVSSPSGFRRTRSLASLESLLLTQSVCQDRFWFLLQNQSLKWSTIFCSPALKGRWGLQRTTTLEQYRHIPWKLIFFQPQLSRWTSWCQRGCWLTSLALPLA